MGTPLCNAINGQYLDVATQIAHHLPNTAITTTTTTTTISNTINVYLLSHSLRPLSSSLCEASARRPVALDGDG